MRTAGKPCWRNTDAQLLQGPQITEEQDLSDYEGDEPDSAGEEDSEEEEEEEAGPPQQGMLAAGHAA